VVSALLLATAMMTLPTSQAATPSVPTLQARRADLVSQLAKLSPAKNDAAHALASAQNSLADVQKRIGGVEHDIKQTNDRLLELSGQIRDDEAAISQARHKLSGMARASYESTSDNAFMNSLFSSSSVSDAMDRIKAEQHVHEQVTDL
jgi:peptidoglycan hydrolase CwlO-like protein